MVFAFRNVCTAAFFNKNKKSTEMILSIDLEPLEACS